MIVIYSKTAVKGVGGVYCDPLLFDGVDSRATLVITKDKHIQDAYAEKGITVKGFPRATTKAEEK